MKSTYPTRTLPTDKHGNVYYGPRTVNHAHDYVTDILNNEAETKVADCISDLCQRMESAGYTGIAARIRKAYGV